MEGNFINDMMNFNNQLITGVIEKELRKVIKGVLGDIYFAHISTLFLENHLIQETRKLAADLLSSKDLKKEYED